MYHNFRLLAGLVLYAVIGSSWAAEQAVTRTITTDLGSNDTTMTVHSGTSSSHVLNVITNTNGTRFIPVQYVGGNIDFSATGANLCKLTVTSPYVNALGRLMMVKSADDFTNALGYSVGIQIRPLYTVGSSSFLVNQNGVAHSYQLGTVTGFGLSTNGDYLSIASNTNGLCKLAFENISIGGIGIFTPDQPYVSSSIIPTSYKGTRTGIINITMTVEGANETPITQ